MNTFNNMMIPILITDKDGIIIYKNRAAKRSIPTPRCKGNINNYLNAWMKDYRINKGDLRIEFVRNSKSAFNRALVYSFEDDRESWFFMPELLISEPEEICKYLDRINPEFIKTLLSNVSERNDTAENALFIRYQRVYSELVTVIKQVNAESNHLRFCVSDILTSLKKKTDELTSKYGLRMSFDAGIYDLWQPYKLDFEAFATIYIQLLSLSLRITDTTGCAISVFPSGRKLVFSVTSAMPKMKDQISPFITTETLCRLYPKQAMNILLLEETAKSHGFILDVNITDDRLALRVHVPFDSGASESLHEDPPKIVISNNFERLETRIAQILEAILLQI
ncbi:MAG: hypothetical protein IJA55_09890 [Clostridia bacterium]|nr:hypothetical protein [Clostridia bacterium]